MCAEYPGNEFKDRAKPRDGLCVQNILGMSLGVKPRDGLCVQNILGMSLGVGLSLEMDCVCRISWE